VRMYDVLVTCPPVVINRNILEPLFLRSGLNPFFVKTTQTLSEDEMMRFVGNYDGWIIGDDRPSRNVLTVAIAGRMRAAVKWGVGVDNIDYQIFKECGIPVVNTPGVFATSVSELALGYLLSLLRKVTEIDRAVRAGSWHKPTTTNLRGKTVGIVGFGSIGKQLSKLLEPFDVNQIIYDPQCQKVETTGAAIVDWPNRINSCDCIVICCSLTSENFHLINANIISLMKPGVFLVNISRGGLIDTNALVDGLVSGQIRGAALDVYEVEPISDSSSLRSFNNVIFGTHNASNTSEDVISATSISIKLLSKMLVNSETSNEKYR